MPRCPRCGSFVEQDNNFCPKCGAFLGESKMGNIREALIGPHPMWLMFSGFILILSGFISIFILITTFEQFPSPFKFSLMAIFLLLIAVGLIFLIRGVRGKSIPTYQIKIEVKDITKFSLPLKFK